MPPTASPNFPLQMHMLAPWCAPNTLACSDRALGGLPRDHAGGRAGGRAPRHTPAEHPRGSSSGSAGSATRHEGKRRWRCRHSRHDHRWVAQGGGPGAGLPGCCAAAVTPCRPPAYAPPRARRPPRPPARPTCRIATPGADRRWRWLLRLGHGPAPVRPRLRGIHCGQHVPPPVRHQPGPGHADAHRQHPRPRAQVRVCTHMPRITPRTTGRAWGACHAPKPLVGCFSASLCSPPVPTPADPCWLPISLQVGRDLRQAHRPAGR
jgi:hypothetical protein